MSGQLIPAFGAASQREPNISQTSYIAGVIFVGFLVFITTRGELPAYKHAILGGN